MHILADKELREKDLTYRADRRLTAYIKQYVYT